MLGTPGGSCFGQPGACKEPWHRRGGRRLDEALVGVDRAQGHLGLRHRLFIEYGDLALLREKGCRRGWSWPYLDSCQRCCSAPADWLHQRGRWCSQEHLVYLFETDVDLRCSYLSSFETAPDPCGHCFWMDSMNGSLQLYLPPFDFQLLLQ